jgi:hypothetical protein
MRISRSNLIASAVIGLLGAYWLCSELYYCHRISPEGVATVQDYFDRFGEPRFVRLIQRDGQTYYEFNGHPPPAYVIAMPSGPPAYVFDLDGGFVTWCSDPGDKPGYRRSWPLQSTELLDVGLVRQALGR